LIESLTCLVTMKSTPVSPLRPVKNCHWVENVRRMRDQANGTRAKREIPGHVQGATYRLYVMLI
jgi:hypothetical protein